MQKQHACGCSHLEPGAWCEQGKLLFEVAVQSSEAFSQGGISREAACHASALYADHVLGWQQGDVKVARIRQIWTILLRSAGRWSAYCASREEPHVRAWLAHRGYVQFVSMGNSSRDHLSGYYRKRALDEETRVLASSLPSHMDLKSEVAMYIALLIAHIPAVPSAVKRQVVQQRVAHLLFAHGIEHPEPYEQDIRIWIEEALQQDARIRRSAMRTALPGQDQMQVMSSC